LSGAWRLQDGLRPTEEVTRALDASPLRRLRFDAAAVERWDTSLVVFLARVHDTCVQREVGVDTSGLPAGARRLLELARQGAVLGGGAEPEPADRWRRERRGSVRGRDPWTERIGWWAIHSFQSLGGKLENADRSRDVDEGERLTIRRVARRAQGQGFRRRGRR